MKDFFHSEKWSKQEKKQRTDFSHLCGVLSQSRKLFVKNARRVNCAERGPTGSGTAHIKCLDGLRGGATKILNSDAIIAKGQQSQPASKDIYILKMPETKGRSDRFLNLSWCVFGY